MYWAGGGILVALLFLAPMVGLFSQPWSGFWFGKQDHQSAKPIAVEFIQLGAPPVPGPVASEGPVSVSEPMSSRTIDALIAEAKTYIGIPYLWGGCNRRVGLDCSCFLVNVFQTFGIQLSRVTVDQVRAVTPVERNSIMPGDLVFFDNTCTNCGSNPTHVGMAIGSGMMIQEGGTAVSIQPIFSGWYGPHFSSAGRVRGL